MKRKSFVSNFDLAGSKSLQQYSAMLMSTKIVPTTMTMIVLLAVPDFFPIVRSPTLEMR